MNDDDGCKNGPAQTNNIWNLGTGMRRAWTQMTRHKKRHDVDDEISCPLHPLALPGVSCLCSSTTGSVGYRKHAGLFWDGRAIIDIYYIQGGRHCMHAWYGWDIPGLTSRLGVGRRYPCIFGCFVCSAFFSFFLFCCCGRWGMSSVRPGFAAS